jgi:hypothetical protein
MPAEVLKLVAQAIDQVSGPIRDMQRSVSLFDQQGRKTHIEGAKLAKLHAAQYANLQRVEPFSRRPRHATTLA